MELAGESILDRITSAAGAGVLTQLRGSEEAGVPGAEQSQTDRRGVGVIGSCAGH